MDKDGSRSLTLEELQQGLDEASMQFSEEQVQKLFSHFDVDATGTVDFEEFLQGLRVCKTIFFSVFVSIKNADPFEVFCMVLFSLKNKVLLKK